MRCSGFAKAAAISYEIYTATRVPDCVVDFSKLVESTRGLWWSTHRDATSLLSPYEPSEEREGAPVKFRPSAHASAMGGTYACKRGALHHARAPLSHRSPFKNWRPGKSTFFATHANMSPDTLIQQRLKLACVGRKACVAP